MTASVSETRQAIDEALKSTGYSCKTVSWDDVSRGTVGGSLSCWGSNITDTRLNAKDGTQLFTVRSDNWNEKLGHVDSDSVALLVGNCDDGRGLRNVTLGEFLNNPLVNGATYTGLEVGTKLSCSERDSKVSIRFQTVFLPVDESGRMQFAPEAYNYETRSDDDPRNLVCLATTQGLSVQADGAGSKRLFLHKRDDSGSVGEYWLEAEQSRHSVGGEQRETKKEREDALARGKATSEVIGIKAMGKRFNVLMTIQIPLEQAKKEEMMHLFMACALSAQSLEDEEEDEEAFDLFNGSVPLSDGASTFGAQNKSLKFVFDSDGGVRKGLLKTRMRGFSRAARVSHGDYHGPYGGISVTAPKRNTAEHVTVTCVLYNTVAGGVPSPEDCKAAVEDMEKLYAACSDSGRLADSKFDFMKSELKVSDMSKIFGKLTEQPPPKAPQNFMSPPPPDGYRLVQSKVEEMQCKDVIVGEDVLMLKLLTLGALKDSETKQLLTKKFDTLKSVVAQQNTKESKKLFVELKQLILGAFENS